MGYILILGGDQTLVERLSVLATGMQMCQRGVVHQTLLLFERVVQLLFVVLSRPYFLVFFHSSPIILVIVAHGKRRAFLVVLHLIAEIVVLVFLGMTLVSERVGDSFLATGGRVEVVSRSRGEQAFLEQLFSLLFSETNGVIYWRYFISGRVRLSAKETSCWPGPGLY